MLLSYLKRWADRTLLDTISPLEGYILPPPVVGGQIVYSTVGMRHLMNASCIENDTALELHVKGIF